MTMQENLRYGDTSSSVGRVVIIVLKERCAMDSIKTILMVTWFGLNILQGVDSDDEIFMVGKKRCLTNGSAALAIIKDISSTDVTYGNNPTQYYPPFEIQCTFEPSWDCGKNEPWEEDGWLISRAMNGPVQQYVTDRRWEDFPMYKFARTSKKQQQVLFLNDFKIFNIPLSVRIGRNGYLQISLCDAQYRNIMNCYCITLAAMQSKIWKCSELCPTDILNYQRQGCWELYYGKTQGNFGVFSEDVWTHLNIVREYNRTQVFQGNDFVMSYFDNDASIYDTKSLIIYSTGNSLWKVHDYYYLLNIRPSIDYSTSVGPLIKISNGTTCLSMFVVMCKTCCLKLTISLKGDYSADEEISREISTQDEKWKEEKIIINTQKYVGKTLSILQYRYQCNGFSNQGLFWAIDDIRFCGETEYRYIDSTDEKFTCQKIGIGQNEILKIDDNEITETGVNCPGNTFGKFCVPCNMFGKNYCGKFVYCDMDQSEHACHCTAGYRGRTCTEECAVGFYGHGCQKACSVHCKGTCKPIVGNCPSGCEEPYQFPSCEKPKVILFSNPPVVTNITSTSGIVRVLDFAVDGPANKTSPKFYNIEYVVDTDQNMIRTGKSQKGVIWHIAKQNIKFAEENEFKIHDLKADTYYLVRAPITAEEKGEYIKFDRFLTTCTDITDKDITINPKNVSATVEIKWPENHCRFTRYQLFCTNSDRSIDLLKPIVLEKLESFAEYSCTIRKGISEVVKKFWTQEGVPSEVRNVRTTADANTISLNWMEPEKKRGKIIKYTIVYFYVGSIGCSLKTNNINRFENSTTLTDITLVDLKFYSKYKIMIYGVTKGGEGESHTIPNIETNQSDNISDEEMLAIESLDKYADSVKVSVTKIDCVDLKGPIYLHGNASCSHEWCSKNNESNVIKFSVDNPFITLTKLFPYSNYTAYLAISRDRKSWKNFGRQEFQTKPSAPTRISHLEVISKGPNFISLRWKQPYPPTGVLKTYSIEYSRVYYSTSKFKDVLPQSCSLWKDYHCGNLTDGISRTYTYSIEIRARNEIPDNYGTGSDILSVMAINELPEPTYGISLFWDEENNLNITWYHPNVTNGALTSFEIILKDSRGESQPEYFPVRETNYSLTYTKTIPSTKIQACTEYKASVRVHNIEGPSQFNYSSKTSPPDIPPNIPMEIVQTEMTNSTITVHVPSIVSSATTLYNQTIYILVSKAEETDDLVLFEKSLKQMESKPNMKTSWLVYESTRSNLSLDFTIGDTNESESTLRNPQLEPGTNYSVSVILSNECYGMMRLRRAQKYISTLQVMGEIDEQTNERPVPDDGNGGLWALILLLFVPLIIFGYWYKKNKHPKGSDLLIPHDSIKHESIALPRMPNPGGKMLSAKPKRSLPQALPPLNTTHSMPIKISDFEEYVKGVVTSGELDRQHGLFPRGMVKPCEYGSLAENKAKNRYKNLIAYDETRVKLQKMRGDEYSDYINANYIDGYKKPRCYIATQGPKNNTLADFWKMIWQEKVRHIVMLANVYENGKKKVEKYWPDINEDLTFGNVRVQHVSADIFANFDIRVFTVHCNNEERKINQLHFTTWPDHGVPLYSQSLVPFLQRVLKIPYNPQSPIVVHCSAGVGRTGTIILSDICLRMAAGEGSIDFLAYLENIRSQRANLVDNIEQYKLAHLVVLECLFGLHTAVPCNEQMKKIVDGILMDDGIQKQMRYIVETQWQDSAMETMLEHEGVLPNYPEKNRFKEIVPRHYRVFLTKYPADDDASFYINAVQADGFRNPGRYISTPQPMPNTLGDFWRMVVERSCTTIISLNTLNSKDKTVCKFWPGNGEELNPLDIITVQHIKTKRLECYKVITVQVKFNREEPFTVDILEIDNWKSNELLPNSIEEFLAFLDAAEAISRNSEHVIVTCYDGATASGLYLAMAFLIEKMKLEQECDVCLAVRTIRHSRKEFVTKEEQYEFLYRASVTFIAGFQSYANFT